jgi:hypothetical protein
MMKKQKTGKNSFREPRMSITTKIAIALSLLIMVLM